MNLENVTAELRPRSPWEATDFGFRLIRRDAAPVYAIWFAATIPLLIFAIALIEFSSYPTFASLLYWWLEPVADGLILHVIAHRLFGAQADVRATLRQVFSIARRNMIFLLPFYRFHFARSIAMPLTQLEGLSGEARRQRASVINRGAMSYGTGVTIAYQHLMLSVMAGIVLIAFFLIPSEYQQAAGNSWLSLYVADDGRTPATIGLLLFYVAQSALEPWFVGAGFGLYINRRTQLEAWDLEVAFRRMVQRRSRSYAAVAAILAASMFVLAPATHIRAQDTPEQSSATARKQPQDAGFAGYWEDADVHEALDAVMAHEEFRRTREVERWQRRDRNEPQMPRNNGAPGLLTWLFASLGRAIAFVTEFGLWIVAAALIAWLVVSARNWLPGMLPASRAARMARVTLAGGEITAEHLPEDVSAKALELWHAGKSRDALSLLYRAGIFHAVTVGGVRIPSGATEGMCLRAIVGQMTDAATVTWFRRVIAVWIACAYGLREPDEAEFVGLCRQWPQHFETAA